MGPLPVTPETPAGRTSLLRPVLTAGVGFALLSATGAPTAKTVKRLADAGVPAEQAAIILHVAPVLIAMAGLAIGLVAVRGRGAVFKSAVLAGAGGMIGFLTAFCLDLFVGVLPALESITGPLREANGLDVAAWALATLSLLYGIMTLAIARFGASAMQAINFENVDPDCLEVRKKDRGMFALSSIGLIGQGVFLGALAVLHQLAPDVSGALRGGTVVVLALGAIAFTMTSWLIWRSMDELMRRMVVESYAWSGLFATAGTLIWATLEALKIAPPVTAYAVIVLLLFVQTLTVMFIAAGFGTPAAAKGAR
jgi:hypothetical protein